MLSILRMYYNVTTIIDRQHEDDKPALGVVTR